MKVFIILVMLFCGAILTGCSSISKDSIAPSLERSGSLNLQGYMLLCKDYRLYDWDDAHGDWRILDNLHPHGAYYLDDKLMPFKAIGCDLRGCVAINGPINWSSRVYTLIGKKSIPKNTPAFQGNKIRAYKTHYASGKIKIEFDYFTDPRCSDKKTEVLLIDE